MEKALLAYSREHINQYISTVKENGLTEHGFPRLTATIGILIAKGRRRDLLPEFVEMMTLCCSMFLRPRVKAANEFSVREIVFCINELEESGVLDSALLESWKRDLEKIVPEECYNKIVESEDDPITNWAVFGAVSEFARYSSGLCGSLPFVEKQLSCQIKWLDSNGMYCDYESERIHQPIVYDYVTRGLFCLLLHLGYRGKYFEVIDSALKSSGICSLKMQSTNGEIPFGGRSNQFIHNEPWAAAVFEYESSRYAREGNTELAKSFKAAASSAISVTEEWLSKQPMTHIKNRYPRDTGYGCEGYAYFDKYMITVASNLYAAYLLCDSTSALAEPDSTATPKAAPALAESGSTSLLVETGTIEALAESNGITAPAKSESTEALAKSDNTATPKTEPAPLALAKSTSTAALALSDGTPCAFATTDRFHKVFLKCGEYMAELDLNADLRYDACGVGRVHRATAPATICMSHPCPSQPKYKLDIAPTPLSICPGIRCGDSLCFSADGTAHLELVSLREELDCASAEISCAFSDSRIISTLCKVGGDGVCLELSGNGDIACMLPAFTFDGEESTEIAESDSTLTVSYGGWVCLYETDGKILDLGFTSANRNGHYRAFCAESRDTLKVKITVNKL